MAIADAARAAWFDVLQHAPPRHNRLTILEVWATRAELGASCDGAAAFRDATLPLLGALFDERVYRQVR